MQQAVLPTCTLEVENKFNVFDHGDGMVVPLHDLHTCSSCTTPQMSVLLTLFVYTLYTQSFQVAIASSRDLLARFLYAR